ncbi:hypothetical protein [Streptomyces sp. NPDC004589]|uniref:hypothetical protein n=1 Tax=Streptomyces sp. NPDC004589 TaxID=3154553 RepID=UPI0033B53A2A
MEIEPNTDGWLEDTRTSYDIVATSYADQVRNLLDETWAGLLSLWPRLHVLGSTG